MVSTDVCIIGAGPVGLFAVFELGLLKLRAHVVDYLPKVGGQLSEIYPRKPIYDIPGFPEILAEDLVSNLMKQIEPFNPAFTLGERVEELHKDGETQFRLLTHSGTEIHCKAVVIAGGLGCFEPRKPAVEGLESFEGKGVNYMIVDPEVFRNKRIVLAGGGDSALDWTVYLADIATQLTLVHRGESFRGAPDTASKVMALANSGKIILELKSNVTSLHGNGHLQSVTISGPEGESSISADYFIPLFGLSPKLGPIENWNLNLEKSAIKVNTDDYSTNIGGIYAIGDINTYTNKLKLILCGFHEAALMSHSVHKRLHPDKNLVLKYTTVNGIQSF